MYVLKPRGGSVRALFPSAVRPQAPRRQRSRVAFPLRIPLTYSHGQRITVEVKKETVTATALASVPISTPPPLYLSVQLQLQSIDIGHDPSAPPAASPSSCSLNTPTAPCYLTLLLRVWQQQVRP